MMEALAAGAAQGVVQGGLQLVGGILQNKANAKMNKDMLRLAYIQRGDTLKQQGVENAFGQQDRAYRERESAYKRLQDKRAAARQALADNQAFKNNIIAALNAARRR